MGKNYHITSESVTEGHPDKISDQISDAIVDDLIRQDPHSRVAVETLVTTGSVHIAGEVTTRGYANVQSIAREVLKEIGYTDPRFGIDSEDAGVWISIHGQSPDISQGVTNTNDKEQGAGDQGMMYGYSCNETPELMPLPIMLAHGLTRRLAYVRKNGLIKCLGPDGKSQVTIEYENGTPRRMGAVVIAQQHTDDISEHDLKGDILEKVIIPVCGKMMDNNTKIHINATGRFVIGGPEGDTGVTGRKIIADTYGGVGRHGGGAFCLAGSSRINTEVGTKKIVDCKDVMGILVKTDVHPMPAGEWWDNGIKETILISTKDGYSLEATTNHLIRVVDEDGRYVWKEVGKLKTGDFIPIQKKNRLFGDGSIGNFKYSFKEGTAEARKKKYIFPTKLTDDYSYLLGLLIGDGDCTDEGCIKICVCGEEEKTNVQRLFQRIFGEMGRIYGHWAYIGGVEMRAYLEFLGLGKRKSFEKTVPKAIWNGTKKNVAFFLRGLFDTDGCVRIDGRNKTSPRIHLATTSKHLAEEVQLLLLNFGIISNIIKNESTGKTSIISGRTVTSRRALYNLIIKGAESIRIFKEIIGFGLSRKQRILDRIDLSSKINRFIVPNQRQRIINLFKKLPVSEQRRDIINIGRFTRKSEGKATKELTYNKLGEFIAAYENFLKDDPEFKYLRELFFMGHYYARVSQALPSFANTYDLNIPLTHTFTANGFVVHNSGKDPSKVDRSGAYMARYVAKNIIAAELAKKCEIQIAYAIGVADPVSVMVDSFGTGKIPDEKITELVMRHFDMRPRGIIDYLNLLRPIYRETARYGHFGRDVREWPNFTWERTDKAEELRKDAGLA